MTQFEFFILDAAIQRKIDRYARKNNGHHLMVISPARHNYKGFTGKDITFWEYETFVAGRQQYVRSFTMPIDRLMKEECK